MKNFKGSTIKTLDIRGVVTSADHVRVKGSAVMRMKQQGYTKKEVEIFMKACYDHDVETMNNIPCKCTDYFQCEICRFKDIEKELYCEGEKWGLRHDTR